MFNYNNKGYTMWFVFALLSGLGAAILAIITKLYLNHLNPLFVTLLFSIVTFCILFVVGFCTKKYNFQSICSLTKMDWIMLCIAGCINCLAFVCYLAALQYGKAAHVVAIDRLGILYVVILSVVFLQQSFTIQSIAGSIMMIIGAILLST